MEFQKLKLTSENGVSTIYMDSPKNLNAFDEELIDELVGALKVCEEDSAVKVVVLTSTGKAFSAGGDIGAMYKGIKSGQLNFTGAIAKMAQVSVAIKKLSKPVIGAVAGAVAGAGFNVALACDYLIAADNATFMQAFVNIGLIPDAGGLYLLTRAVGVNKALELSMTGRPVLAEEAKSLGFVANVVAAEDLEKVTMATAAKFAKGPRASYAEMKRLMYINEFSDFESYIEEEVKSQVLCGDTDDFKEGVCAFVEKRKPEYEA
ncbi:enoyl-CoA hydratase-related protein [Eubacteriaceae bacterium ES3]|nr:enoyl-CoA hydratase-related protein [Eubacteriaceae bacterium ES3]